MGKSFPYVKRWSPESLLKGVLIQKLRICPLTPGLSSVLQHSPFFSSVSCTLSHIQHNSRTPVGFQIAQQVQICIKARKKNQKQQNKNSAVTMWCGIYRIARDGYFKGNHSAKASCCGVQMAKPESEFRLPLWQPSHNTLRLCFLRRLLRLSLTSLKMRFHSPADKCL